MTEERGRRYWVWVTRSEYYLDDDGSPRADLDPAHNPGLTAGLWWTCHEETMAGDLVLLYRTAPKSDVAYVLEATSNARLLGRDQADGVVSWTRFREMVREAHSTWPDAYEDNDKFDSAVDELLTLEEQRDEVARRWERLRENPQDSDLLEAFDEVAGDFSSNLRDFRMWVEDALDMDYLPFEHELGLGTDSFVCDWRPRYRFDVPLGLADLKGDQFLADNWNALRASFSQRAYRTTPEIWSYLIDKAERSGNNRIKGAL